MSKKRVSEYRNTNPTVARIDREISDYERMKSHAIDRMEELMNKNVHPSKRGLLNQFMERLHNDIEAFSNQIGLLECEKMGLES